MIWTWYLLSKSAVNLLLSVVSVLQWDSLFREEVMEGQIHSALFVSPVNGVGKLCKKQYNLSSEQSRDPIFFHYTGVHQFFCIHASSSECYSQHQRKYQTDYPHFLDLFIDSLISFNFSSNFNFFSFADILQADCYLDISIKESWLGFLWSSSPMKSFHQ